MKRLAWFLHAIEVLGVFYLLGGIRLHSLIVGEVASQTYYHNWAVAVAVGTFAIMFLCVVVLSFGDSQIACREAKLAFGVTLIVGLAGMILSTGRYGGSFLSPGDFGIAIPAGLAFFSLLALINMNRVKQGDIIPK